MANKSIKELPKATQIQEDDALPMQQGPTTKQVTGLTLTLWLLGMADGHGGVKDFQKLSEGYAKEFLTFFAEGLACQAVDARGDVSGRGQCGLPPAGVPRVLAAGLVVGVGVLHGRNELVAQTDVEGWILFL